MKVIIALALVAEADAYAHMTIRAMPSGRRAGVVQLDDGVPTSIMAGLDPSHIPPRWRGVHDCERPARWREVYTEDECELYDMEVDAGRVPSLAVDKVLQRRKRWRALGRLKLRRKYTEIVPQLETMEDLLAVCKRAAAHHMLVVVKYYASTSSVRIAAKYRKLALKYREDVVCCAILKRDESDLLERLEVATVPSVQIFDGERATRLGECACEVGMFVDVEKKVLSAIMAMKKKRSFLRRLVDQRPNLMRLASSLGDEPTIKMKRTSAR